MISISRDSLQWKIAVKTFISSAITGLVAIAIIGYLHFSRSVTNSTTDIIIFYSLAIIVLLISASLFSLRSYFSLSSPLSSLDQITSALPLLSSKKYDEAREIFKLVEDISSYHEINQLQFASLQLTSLLEKLDANVSQRSKLIHSKNLELQHERDFIQSLLDTAQLIIVTINADFDITLFNEYGEKLTGYTKFEMVNTSVSKMFPAGNWTEAQVLFNEILAGNIPISQQEAELIDKEGRIRQVSWLHSRIEGDKSDAVILSVGLDMTEKKEAEKRIVWMAEHDPLTDLCNRRKFTEEFEKSLQTAIRYQHNNALLFLDLDQFKDINDTSGHRAGDELLQSVAKVLQRVTRLSDLVARLGGDEFAILIPETNNEGAVTLAKKIIQELGQIPLSYGAVKHKVSTSIGIVHYPLHDASIHELLGFADLAMYKSKANGKGTYHTFSPDDQTQEQLETRVFWKHQIETALENNNFVLHYQPIMEVKSNTIQHYEVLIRMLDNDTGEIRMPGKFIKIAEEVGLIHNIDHYVLQRGMMKLAEMQKKDVNVTLSINLSGSVVDDPVLLPMLKDFIKKYDVRPEGLIFEITETAAVSNLQQAKTMMAAIRALGCKFSLDDFGVGFTSFNYMRELPVDIIKIDGIFIKDLDKNADDQLFVKALVDIAKGLGKKTIAEFVENKEILTLLRAYGVDYAQGYYIGHPQDTLRDDTDWQPKPVEKLIAQS
ncbi:MAG: EAL domain-containing protein [Gammaproteobacteria bacterium]|nr:EAL domain-containing protein [Gammaproteobacteria bacterium]MDH5591731.1 EAL domain-containing protein [Gammaproteobacteria bacterium]